MYYSKKDKRWEQSCKKIYTALRDLMAEQDYGSISVTGLAERAGVGRATFYRSFDSIEDVLRMECDRRFLQLGETMTESARKTASAGELHRLFLEFWYEDPEIIKLLIQTHHYEIIVQANLHMLSGLSEKHSIALYIPENYLEYLMVMQSGLTIGLLVRWIENGMNIPPAEMGTLLEQSQRSLRELHEGALAQRN